jgi:hypothetical protein
MLQTVDITKECRKLMDSFLVPQYLLYVSWLTKKKGIWYLKQQCFYRATSFAVEWLALLLRIREVPGSNLGPKTGYLYCGFSWFSSVPPGKCWDITLKQAMADSFHILSNSLSSYHSSLYSLSLLTASLNKPHTQTCHTIIWQTQSLYNNNIGNVYSLEYIRIPKCSLRHIMGDDVNRTTKGITKATVLSKVFVATI